MEYRDGLILMIKSAGQEIIDRAEQMVSKDTDLITGFTITCTFPQDAIPIIEWRTEAVNKQAVAKLRGESDDER